MKKIFCGLLLALMIAVSGGFASAHAMDYPSNLPTLPEFNPLETHVVVYTVDGGTYLVMMTAINSQTFDFTTTTHDGGYTTFNVMFGTSSAIRYIYFKSGDVWQHMRTDMLDKWNTNYEITGSNDLAFVYSTADIYDTNTGQLVFPLPPAPLYQIVGKVTTEATMEEITGLGATVIILVTMAISCLVLLVVLKILPKILHRFQAK